ncbi:hypothetical protein B296_00037692 [Ensete ventricosum]|uniref:Uncharacterized protein n=1 Tax=Ensete ventricosum TaxID=4639 RepID=A0A426X915_ENSVE|nr:hypothetical protein B296_00037692 [Ensete ventricosum]
MAAIIGEKMEVTGGRNTSHGDVVVVGAGCPSRVRLSSVCYRRCLPRASHVLPSFRSRGPPPARAAGSVRCDGRETRLAWLHHADSPVSCWLVFYCDGDVHKERHFRSFSNGTLCSGDWRRSGGGRDRLQPPADSHAHLRYPPPLSPVPIHVVFAVSSLKCCRLHPRPVGKPFRHTSASSLAA